MSPSSFQRIRIPVNKVRATVLLFSSGKIVCAGLTETEQIRKAIEIIDQN